MGQARRRKQAGTYPDRVQLREWEESVLGEWRAFYSNNDGTRTEIGAVARWSPARHRVLVVPEKIITIGELEALARALLADDDEPFVPAPRFRAEIRNGTTVMVHPDRRVQSVLERLREGALERVAAEARDEARQLMAVRQAEIDEAQGR